MATVNVTGVTGVGKLGNISVQKTVVITTTSASAQTWSVPADCSVGTLVHVECWGAGSSGSGGVNSSTNGAAGAGGNWADTYYALTSSDIASGITFTSKAGPAGTTNANSNVGPDTSFGTAPKNLIQNTINYGAVVGSPGTLPMGWAVNGKSAGLTISVVGQGVDGGTGLNYIDVRFNGTTNTAGLTGFFFGGTTFDNTVPISPSLSYTASAYMTMIAGSMTNLPDNLYLQANVYTTADVYVATYNPVYASTISNGTLTRYSGTFTSDPTANLCSLIVFFPTTNTAPVDITLRIAGVQLEQAASVTTYQATPTSYVLAKGGAANVTTTGGISPYEGNSFGINMHRGGTGATRAQLAGGGGAAGKDGNGASPTTATGGTGDNGLGGAAGVSNVEGGGGSSGVAAGSAAAAGAPGGGGGGATATSGGTVTGGAGGRGQVRITYAIPQIRVSLPSVSAVSALGTVTTTAPLFFTAVTATGVVNSVTASLSESPSLTAVTATGVVNSLIVKVDDSATPTAVTATGVVNLVTVQIDDSASPTAVTATGVVNSVTVRIDASPSSVTATGVVNSVNVQVDDSTTLVAVTSAGTLGTISISLSQQPSATAVTSTGVLGTITTKVDDSAAATAVTSSGVVNNLTVQIDDSATLTAVTSSGAVNNFTAQIDDTGTVTTVSATGVVGTVTTTTAMTVLIVAVTSSVTLGSLTVKVDDSAAITAVTSSGTLGTVSVQVDDSAAFTAVVVSGVVNSLTVQVDDSATLTSVNATGAVNNLTVQVDDSAAAVAVTSSGTLGTLSVQTDSGTTVSISAVTSTGVLGSLSIQLDASVTLVAVTCTSSLGILTTSTGQSQQPSISGVAVTGVVNDVTLGFSLQQPSLNGVTCVGTIGSVSIYVGIHEYGYQEPGGSGADVAEAARRQKWLEWSRKRKKKQLPPTTIQPVQREIVRPTPIAHVPEEVHVSPELATNLVDQLLARNLANQRTQLAEQTTSIVHDELSRLQTAERDDEEAILLLLHGV